MPTPSPFAAVQSESSQRFAELRIFWSGIKLQAVTPPSPQPFIYLAGSGFTVVYLYAVFEFTITRAVKQLSQLITDYNVRACDVAYPIMTLVHEPRVASVRDSGKRTRISSRLNLFLGLSNKQKAVIYDNVIVPDLQNIWVKSISDTFSVFGISGDYLSNLANGSSIAQLVNDRNAVAHGRERPETVGAAYTTADLDDLISKIETESQFIVSRFENFFEGREFIENRHRKRYMKKEGASAAQ